MHTGIHISGGEESDGPFTTACASGPLTAQEKALDFLIFDLSSCIQRDDQVPTPPVVE